MEKTMVRVGQYANGTWIERPQYLAGIVPLNVAAKDMSEHFGCTVENAKESLVKCGYSSTPYKEWHVVGGKHEQHEIELYPDRSANDQVIGGYLWSHNRSCNWTESQKAKEVR